jgi:3-deoxy-D-manno-octulosonate 8-phosphate phosphatase (KDO 8-P phosphatase)
LTIEIDKLSAEHVRILRGVRLAVLDFDGVLTDNTVIVNADGSESVRCWRGDGYGMKALERAGITVVILSSELVPVVKARAKKLGVRCECTPEPKETILANIVADVGCSLAEVLYIGNDVNDAGCLSAVGMPIVVADCHPDVRPLAKIQTTIAGGLGAVREVCDLVIRAREDNR